MVATIQTFRDSFVLASPMEMLNFPFNMKKVSVRQIVYDFSKLHDSLKPGQSVDITSHGQSIGQYIKRPARRAKLPNFYKEACKLGYGPKVGDALMKRLLADGEWAKPQPKIGGTRSANPILLSSRWL